MPSVKVKTPVFRASYVSVFQPKPGPNNSDPRYSISMLFNKDQDLTELRTAARKATELKWGSKIPKNLRSPFRDGDEERPDDKNYSNIIFINASSNSKPGVVDASLNDIKNPAEFYSGCYARATLFAFAYDNSGNRGVSFALGNIQKVREGPRLDGRKEASEDFDAWDDDGSVKFKEPEVSTRHDEVFDDEAPPF